MSSGEIRKVSCEKIKEVQGLIEHCLELYMRKEEVINTLFNQWDVEPSFTELVWQKLEDENKEFFRAYHLRLMVKDQIVEFNRLLGEQVELIRQITPAGVASLPLSNGSHIKQPHQSSGFYVSDHTEAALRAENMPQPVGSSLHNTICNGGSPLHPCTQNGVDMSTHAGRIDAPPNMRLTQRSNGRMIQGMNAGPITLEAGYADNSSQVHVTNGKFFETCPPIVDGPLSSFSSVESNSQPLNESLLNMNGDTSSFGFLRQISQNFSLSDLTAHFSSGSDILDFVPADTDDFFPSSHGKEENQGSNAPC